MKRGNDYLVAKTFHGLESILSEELRQLGAKQIKRGKRMVTFEGDQDLLYKANLWCRTAIRILVPIRSFSARNEEELYQGIRRIPWRQYLRVHDTFAIDAVVHSRYFRHSRYAALKSKDAIVDMFRERTGQRPSVQTTSPRLRIHVHIREELVTVYRDSSGDSLHRRGYRQTRHKAPLSEVLAAGMILLSGWKGDRPFMDPMCGSGTIPIEAAMIAGNRAPGLGRKFGFETWPDLNRRRWRELQQEAEALRVPITVPIFASDQALKAVTEARQMVFQAGVGGDVDVVQKKISAVRREGEEGILIMNPPYGERMNPPEIHALYREIGDQLKQAFSNWTAYMISSNTEALKKVGLRPSYKYELYNGPLACRYYGYELYKGSRDSSSS